jgi:hypothetical protein
MLLMVAFFDIHPIGLVIWIKPQSEFLQDVAILHHNINEIGVRILPEPMCRAAYQAACPPLSRGRISRVVCAKLNTPSRRNRQVIRFQRRGVFRQHMADAESHDGKAAAVH